MVYLGENINKKECDNLYNITNLDIRLAISEAGFTMKAVSERMGISPQSLSRLMGKPLSDRKRKQILVVLAQLKEDDRSGDATP